MGNAKDAISFLVKTFDEMEVRLTSRDAHQLVYLIRSKVWMMLEQGNRTDALNTLRIQRGPDQRIVSAETLSLAQYFFVDELKLASAENETQLAAMCAELITLLHYLQEHDNISVAIEKSHAFENSISFTSKSSELAFHEMLDQYRVKLILFHIQTHRDHRPLEIKNLFLESVRAFPANTEILAAYTKYERAHGLADRLRNMFRTDEAIEVHPDSLSLWISKIWYTFHHYPEFDGSVNSTRSALERAVRSKLGKHSIALWKTYLRFERQHGDHQSISKLGARALEVVPGSKWVIMEWMAAMADAEMASVCRALWKSLYGRGLRILSQEMISRIQS
jgi:hypothetical protein